MSCSAFPHCQNQQEKKVPEEQLCPKLADSLSEGCSSQVSFLVRWLMRLPAHSKALLNSKFILHREEERIRHKL